MNRLLIAIVVMLVVTGAAAQADQVPCPLQKLLVGDAEGSDRIGYAIAVDGERAVVGCPGDDNDSGGWSAGAVVVCRLQGSAWEEVAEVVAPDRDAGDNFGRALALENDCLVIGAPGDDDGGFDAGAVYVFRLAGEIWQYEAKLIAGDAADGDALGRAVALSGARIVAGACFDDDAGYDSGSAYVFVDTDGEWSEEAKLVPADGLEFDGFGDAVAIDGQTVLVGAWRDDHGAVDSGSAYLFERDGDGWLLTAKLAPGIPSAGDFFGYAVALDGELALIGARGDDGQGNDAGAAYLYERDGGAWSSGTKLLPGAGAHGDRAGMSVALAGGYALLGASGAMVGGENSGAAFLFRRDGDDWPQAGALVPDDGAGGDRFGLAVGLGGGTALVGAPWDDDLGSATGALYTFGLDSLACGTVAAELQCLPASGTLPFATGMTAILANNVADQARIFAARLDVTLASGQHYPNWRAGYTIILPGGQFLGSWVQQLPLLGTLVGDNMFQLVVQDVTPAPYNQPPHQPSGDTDTDGCSVEGVNP